MNPSSSRLLSARLLCSSSLLHANAFSRLLCLLSSSLLVLSPPCERHACAHALASGRQVNLFLAVIFLEFDQAQAQIKADQEAAKTDRSSSSSRAGSRAVSRSGSPQPMRGPNKLDVAEGGGDAAGAAVGDVAGAAVGDAAGGANGGCWPVDLAAESSARPLLADAAGRSDVDAQLSSRNKDATAGPSFDCDLVGRVFLPIATSDALGNFSTALVLLNMLLMCMPYEGMSKE